jgi:hypothetical protein
LIQFMQPAGQHSKYSIACIQACHKKYSYWSIYDHKSMKNEFVQYA